MDTGETGDTAFTGETGESRETGKTGETWETGETGETEETGLTGLTLMTGPNVLRHNVLKVFLDFKQFLNRYSLLSFKSF